MEIEEKIKKAYFTIEKQVPSIFPEGMVDLVKGMCRYEVKAYYEEYPESRK